MNSKISVGIVSRTFFNMPYWIAIQKNFFGDEGLEAETTMYGNASQVPPLLDGTLSVVLGTPEACLQNAASGGPLRIIGGNTGKLTHSLIARSPFARVEDLKGATIGILNMTEGTFFQIKEMLAAHGLHYPGDYTVKETGGVPHRHKALLDGSIDAGLQSIPWNYVAEDAGLRKLGDIIDYVPDWQFVTINANTDWARDNRETIVRFLRAIVRATDWFYANREEAAQIAERELPTPSVHAKRAWDHYTKTNAMTRGTLVNEKGLEKVITTLIQADLLPRNASTKVADYIVDDFLAEAKGP
jgi:ABC-type nitrate/sulfonate/bicarbonate transport system substrate-binding protein